MNNPPKILLTGASGTVGMAVLKQLYAVRNSVDLTIFDLGDRKTRSLLEPYSDGVNIVYGDLTNIKAITQVCRDKDVVIHLAAVIPPRADDDPELAMFVNTTGTKYLVQELERSSPGAFFIYSSSISVYGDRLSNPYIRVGDPLMASEGDEYAKTKIAAEDWVTGSKLDWTIFRLTAIMGNHSDTKLMFHMPLNTSLEIATPEDTGRAFVNAIGEREILKGRIFNLGGGESCRTTYKEFLSRSYSLSGLGKLNFPDKAFAEKNFHCGYYEDGGILDDILHFRQNDLDDYFQMEKRKIPWARRMVISIFQRQIKKGMLKLSEPYQAFHTNNNKLTDRFF